MLQQVRVQAPVSIQPDRLGVCSPRWAAALSNSAGGALVCGRLAASAQWLSAVTIQWHRAAGQGCMADPPTLQGRPGSERQGDHVLMLHAKQVFEGLDVRRGHTAGLRKQVGSR